MSEKLIIKNFGPIKSVELELGRFNVLIGEQATGKSTVAKVLAVCRYFSYIFGNSEVYSQFTTNFPFLTGLEAWGLVEELKDESSIYYECIHYSFFFEKSLGEVPHFRGLVSRTISKLKSLSPQFTNLLPERYNDQVGNGSWFFERSFYQNEVAKVMDNPFYLPTERGLQSIFSLGKSSIQNISDSLFNQFARLDQIARSFKNDTLIKPLDITYKNVDGKGFIRKNNDDKYYSLYNAASGYQSTIPVVLSFENYIYKKKNKTFIVEEPELNLFPGAQHELIKYLVDKTLNYGNTVLITTHSPYILTSLNNLIQAHLTGSKRGRKQKTAEIISQQYWLNNKDVSAYMLKYDEEAKGIVHENILDEDGLIKAEKIDGVSRTLNEEFDKLLNIEFAIKK